MQMEKLDFFARIDVLFVIINFVLLQYYVPSSCNLGYIHILSKNFISYFVQFLTEFFTL